MTDLNNAIVYKMDLDEVGQYMKDCIAAGAIVKVRFAEVRERLGRMVDSSSSFVRDVYFLNLPHEKRTELMNDIYYALPANMHELIAFTKRMNKIEESTGEEGAMIAAAKAMIAKYVPFAADVATLKPLVVTAAKVRAEKKEVEQAAVQKVLNENGELLALLNSYRAEFVAVNEKMAGEQYDTCIEAIRNAGGLDNIAPEPSRKTMNRYEYVYALNRRNWYGYILKTSRQDHVASAAKQAEMSFDSWVAKMVQKIGEVTVSAAMAGSPWTGAKLTVTTKSGEKQVWTTQMIVNQSKYGKLFNQFPSRRKS